MSPRRSRRREQSTFEPTPAASFARHVIADISYAREWIRCTCGAEVTAPADEILHDAHEPLCAAWNAHKLDNARHRKPRMPPADQHAWVRAGEFAIVARTRAPAKTEG